MHLRFIIMEVYKQHLLVKVGISCWLNVKIVRISLLQLINRHFHHFSIVFNHIIYLKQSLKCFNKECT